MLHVHFANRFETLSDMLNEQTAKAPKSVFSQDQIIVPSAAVQRRLTLDIARWHGICSNVRFDYLGQWLWQQVTRLDPSALRRSPLDTPVLVWRVYDALANGAWVATHARLAGYLESADALTRLELARRVAAHLDQYATYRPEWLQAWSGGASIDLGTNDPAVRADERWQADLWKQVTARAPVGASHLAAAFAQALEFPLAASAMPALAAGVHVFCLPTMPPLHLALLQVLGQRTDIHLYVLNPCRQYWFEVVNSKRLAYLAARGEMRYHEVGHRLLAGWGQQTQSQLMLLVDADSGTSIDDADFVENPNPSLLARLQNSILDMADLAPQSVLMAGDDRSVEVHVCHSLARELEVLQDRLLGLQAGPAPPAPGDILVVTPDLDTAAALVDAVFGTAPRDRFIPYTITGRPRSTVNPCARALLDLLALAGSRFQVSAVFALLQQPPVARRFGLDANDLDQVRTWLQAAGVHWALDADHRVSLDLPALGDHSFADAMDRLFLGYALPSHVDQPFDGRLPAGEPEGSDALTLGPLAQFIDALAKLRRAVSKPRHATAWPGLLATVLAAFVAADDTQPEDLGEVHSALEQLGTHLQLSALAQPLPLDVVRNALAQELDDPIRGGVPTGMVTFTSISSLRNIPFKVVCAIGMNDGAFPTGAQSCEFDLLARQPRRGDRQRRIDERNLFLDLLLSARERVHLSYAGRSVRDNALMPASVLVSELLEYLIPAIAVGDDAQALQQAQARLVVQHPLQAFSQTAFRPESDPRLRSFNSEYAQALRASLAGASDRGALPPAPVPAERGGTDIAHAHSNDDAVGDQDDDAPTGPAARFFASPLPAPGPEWRDVSLEQLQQFFRNPCRYLLVRRLNVELRRDNEELLDDEPFLADVPSRNALARRLVPPLMQGADLDALRALALAGTDVPMGAFGRQFLERELAGLQAFADRVREHTQAPCLAPHAVSLELPIDGQTWRLHAAFADLRPGGLLGYRYDAIRAADYLQAWLRHLMHCARPAASADLASTWLGRDGHFRFDPCPQPLPVLESLLRLYAKGLQQPLYFFPKSAWAYIDGGSLGKAAKAWQVSTQTPHAEGADAAYRLALRGLPDPMDAAVAEFQSCAHAVLDPLMACLAKPQTA